MFLYFLFRFILYFFFSFIVICLLLGVEVDILYSPSNTREPRPPEPNNYISLIRLNHNYSSGVYSVHSSKLSVSTLIREFFAIFYKPPLPRSNDCGVRLEGFKYQDPSNSGLDASVEVAIFSPDISHSVSHCYVQVKLPSSSSFTTSSAPAC